MPLEAGDAPLALPLTSISSTFLFSPCHLALCNLPVLAKSKYSLMESNSSLTSTHPVCPRTSWLKAPQYCWMSVPSVAPSQHGSVLCFLSSRAFATVMECSPCLSSCLPCCPLAPRWSFSDANADCSALTKCDAKRRGRHQNRLLGSAVHDSGFLECPLFLLTPCCSAPDVKVSSFLPGLETAPPDAVVIPDLSWLWHCTCPDPWKGGKRAVFH